MRCGKTTKRWRKTWNRYAKRYPQPKASGPVWIRRRRLSAKCWTTPLPGSYIYSECVGKGFIPDEEQYLIRLGKMTMNSEGNIILNISGLNDDVMEDLFIRANNKMNFNFYCQMIKENVAFAFSLQFLKKFFISYILSNKVLCRNIYVLRKKGYI
jgi:hypothetical protein